MNLVICTEVLNVTYSGKKQPLSTRLQHILSLRVPIPIEFELWLDDLMIGTSVNGVLNCWEGSAHLTDVGNVYCTVGQDKYLGTLDRLGADHRSLRLCGEPSIRFIPPDSEICEDPAEIPLVLEYYNVWQCHKQQPFGWVGRWYFAAP